MAISLPPIYACTPCTQPHPPSYPHPPTRPTRPIVPHPKPPTTKHPPHHGGHSPSKKPPLPPVVLPPIIINPPPVITPPVIAPPITNPPVITPPPSSSYPPYPPGSGACVDVLGGLVHVGLGNPVENVCCPVLKGLLELEAAICLCTSIRLKLLNLTIYIPLALQVLITCGQTPPPVYGIIAAFAKDYTYGPQAILFRPCSL
ncbi:36.4 kDa proline-rich protein [Populus alba x Populus x berolinensis]|uniref:36.4 kDa proline-rich protein n=1 Tax=Populus alba x Populus x berolinensis TaxID=444605 RepID=A0AAD6R7X7_9ROSI|nr:36.4 kDa proline-rich protein [Populus alba x Populus x berolinensis]